MVDQFDLSATGDAKGVEVCGKPLPKRILLMFCCLVVSVSLFAGCGDGGANTQNFNPQTDSYWGFIRWDEGTWG